MTKKNPAHTGPVEYLSGAGVATLVGGLRRSLEMRLSLNVAARERLISRVCAVPTEHYSPRVLHRELAPQMLSAVLR